jgi:hypothetical protein
MAERGQGQIDPAQGPPGGASGHMGMGHTERPRTTGSAGTAQRRDEPAVPDTLVGPAAWAAGEPGADVWHVGGADGSDTMSDAIASSARRESPARSSEAIHTAWLRIQARQQLREFLRAVPRREAKATLALMRVDGTTRVFTRAELSAAIDRLRPRQRQIVRLAIEDRWPRQRVCEYLRHISIKTFERDQVEALDRIAEM